MERFGPRSLVLLAVTATMALATPAVAETYKRTGPDGTVYFTNAPNDPSFQRIAFTPATATRVPLPQRTSRSDHGAYAREIAEASGRYAVPERLIWAVIRAESGFDHRAVSRTGARGLMQLMPETAAVLGVRDAFNPRQNIDGGVRHLRHLLERFRNDLHLAIAAYNAGEKPVVVYGGIPPYPETQEYVARVLGYYGAPVEWARFQGNGVYQVVERDGTVVYTNIPPRRLSVASHRK